MARIKEKALTTGDHKKRLIKVWRRRRKEAVESVAQADQQIEKLLIRRFDRLVSVRRFVFFWVALVGLLIFCTFAQLRSLSPYYQTLQPVPGGLYTEGLIGSFTNANPMYSTGAADAAISRLIFSGLFKYDDQNQLVGDLAKDFTVDETQTHYAVHLRHGIEWQDGKPFSAKDVVYTYHTIQNIEAQSPLFSSWQSINVTSVDNYTVAFDLPNALSSFPYSLTNGIVPEHILSKIPPVQLRSAPFNTTAPIGTGPFQWRFIEVTGTDASRQQRISLSAYKNYWAGKPKLDGISILAFPNDQLLLSAFEKKQLNAISGLDNVPASLAADKSVQIHNTPLTTAVMEFFNTSRPVLNDKAVRQALISATNTKELISQLPYAVKAVDEPLLKNQLGYDPTVTQRVYNPAGAAQLLDQNGWKADATGMRSKGAQKLEFNLITSQSAGQYSLAAEFLQKQWAEIGASVHITYPPTDDDLQAAIANHDYDSLLYGINIGVDPDVFAFWDSTQASVTSQGHLNLSEYRSSVADQALEAARTRSDPAIRAVKYKAFLAAWSDDAPALGLYQPNFTYITRGPVYGYHREALNSSTDRFYNVNQWQIRQEKRTVE